MRSSKVKSLLVVSATLLLPAQPASAVTIDTVPVGNPGNAGQVHPHGTFGAVPYVYRIGTFEVTNTQYAEFLTAKAASDPLALYDTLMTSNIHGGITRSGSDGGYTYAVKTNMADKPVNFVTWYDALRFANWMHNDQGVGDTETGAYTLLGGTPQPSNGLSITRNPGARWSLPSENEWYKAAYYDPALGGSGGYWDYPTQSNMIPTRATANSVGDISNPGANVANHTGGAQWNGVTLAASATTVGSAGPLSRSYYGTFDQGGNLAEWNDTRNPIGLRGRRGGAWATLDSDMRGSYEAIYYSPAAGGIGSGFRVATITPEPPTLALAGLGFVGFLALAWRRKRGC